MTGHDVRVQMASYYRPPVVDKILSKCAGDKIAKPFVDEAQQTNIESNISFNMS